VSRSSDLTSTVRRRSERIDLLLTLMGVAAGKKKTQFFSVAR